VVTRPEPGIGFSDRPASSPGGGAESAIGVFDSGIGGLTVVKAILELQPNEPLIYLGDTARTPYGTKSAEVVCRYSFENTEFLVARGVKLLVVTCNTSSAVALEALRERHEIPVVGVIEPGASAAATVTRNGKIGIIGTEATIRSGGYTRALRRIRPDLEIYTRACPLFVPLAEEGWIDNEVARSTAELYLNSMRKSGIDTLILGCTHYPLLANVIRDTMGSEVILVDSATATANAVRAALETHGLASGGPSSSASFFVTDSPDRFVKVGSRFLGTSIDSAVQMER
jgi:glutamate racemase